MKPTYQGFEAKESKQFLDVPPVGLYEAKILNIRLVKADDEDNYLKRDYIELFIDITEGEYKGRYMELWNDQREKWGDKTPYKGIYRLVPYVKGDEEWRRSVFEGALWCVEQSNGFKPDGEPNYHWDWEEKNLVGKKVGINVRKRLYTYKDKDRETTEIGKLESINDIKNGKAKLMNPNDRRKNKGESADSTDGSDFTDVSKTVDVPW